MPTTLKPQRNTTVRLGRTYKHGYHGTVVYARWQNMKHRCYYMKDKDYHNYGARGIAVCDRWRTSFENFLADMGEPPTIQHTLDRLDSDGNYEPSNCRWATLEEQANNKRSNRYLTFNGETLSMSQWARRLGIDKTSLFCRLKRESVESALQGPRGRNARLAYLKSQLEVG